MNKFHIIAFALLFFTAGCEDPRQSTPKKLDPTTLLKGGDLIFEDDFSRAELGADWKDKSEGRWSIKDGWVHGANVRNDALWLNTNLPPNVRIEFDAKSPTKEGDLKCEVFAMTQAHQAGYVIIFGGWKNQINTIARLDEHGKDRIEERTLRTEEVDGKTVTVDHRVKTGKTHHFTVIRKGNAIYWFVDGAHYLTFDDPHPVKGPYFGFNDWTAPVLYDNLKIFRLGY